jgi:hypothetical protein
MCTLALSMPPGVAITTKQGLPTVGTAGPQASSAWISGCDTGLATARRDRCYRLGGSFVLPVLGRITLTGGNCCRKRVWAKGEHF